MADQSKGQRVELCGKYTHNVKDGRLTIPAKWRKPILENGDAMVIVGCGDHFEAWLPDAYDELMAEFDLSDFFPQLDEEGSQRPGAEASAASSEGERPLGTLGGGGEC